jgi:hypothetical protein
MSTFSSFSFSGFTSTEKRLVKPPIEDFFPKTIAMALVREVGDVSRFPTLKEFSSYMGVLSRLAIKGRENPDDGNHEGQQQPSPKVADGKCKLHGEDHDIPEV